MRIQKVLAHSGVGSRRTIESLIEQGLVKVDGIPAKKGQAITGKESINVRGKKVQVIMPEAAKPRLLLMNKPTGWICSHAEQTTHPQVYSALPKLKQGRWISVGRLDVNSGGLLLFTNDGKMAQLLMHPSSKLTRVYQVRVLGEMTEEQITAMKTGVKIDEHICKFQFVNQLSAKGANKWYEVGILEGRNRVVRKLFESQLGKVNKLVRTAHGPFKLPQGLPRGKYIEISQGIWQLKLASILKS